MGLKDKLPLLNSPSKIVRIVGYVLYAFVILMVIGAMAGDPSDTPKAITESSQPNEEQPKVEEKKSDNLTEEDVEDIIGSQKSIAVSDDGYVVVMRPDEDYWNLVLQESDTTDMFKELF